MPKWSANATATARNSPRVPSLPPTRAVARLPDGSRGARCHCSPGTDCRWGALRLLSGLVEEAKDA
eukprot:scaffold2720_cov212-Pinguiococcus_pyrenoidosus.AAC.8